ncbi:hypothetical protein BJY21_000083 [Kineosphaera limosa]|uniref:Uncharacterized protein n=1 Tax=Kineosphaera limosa NBRC 100340 TaxID=1184609 RepID=K6WLU9_9MICO|nr:hypothetical protein [Kineosphaera limosa]NYD98898.1 hypothetical protein [Kineosphaera limosa]GAB94776.1 hypothetical protein KILIM_011_00490 [Kineosphaera limosa NBRC 100340]
MTAIACEPARRYSVLITPGDDDHGTWHTITAASIGEALRSVRSALFWETAQIRYSRDEATVSAIECLGNAH